MTAGLLAVLLLPGGLFPRGDVGLGDLRAAEPVAEVAPAGAAVGAIVVEVKNIFDPAVAGENRLLFRAANRLHRTTRPNVIRQQLLLRSGDPYEPALVEESERLLRSRRYIGDVSIEALPPAGGRVDLKVVTQDAWTLHLGAGFGRGGGVNSTGFQVQDANFLGTGKAVTLERIVTVDRTETMARYADPNVRGSRVTLEAFYSDNSDGSERTLEVERPFYSIPSRWTAGGAWSDIDRIDTFYTLGHESAAFSRHAELGEIRGGLARLRAGRRALRFVLGFTWDDEEFAALPGKPYPASLPMRRTLAYPWLAFDTVEDRFEEARDFDRIGRVEDLELGSRFHARLGYSAPAFGGDRGAVLFDTDGRLGERLTRRQTLIVEGRASGRWSSGRSENARFGGSVRYYLRDFGDQLFFVLLEGERVWRLDPDQQLLLGGDSGLRGYPLRYQEGDARALLTVEQRLFTRWYPLRLVHVGGAVFCDIGRTWNIDKAPGAAQLGLLRDVGLGLRFASSRADSGAILHVDWAFPLDGDPSIRRSQFLVSTKTTF